MTRSNNKNPLRTIGAIAPSSKRLAVEMTSIVDTDAESLSILEVGGGTGALTKELLKKTGKNHYVDVVEVIPKFHSLLKLRFSSYQNVNFHCKDIRDFNPSRRYDVIISSLPFNIFPKSLVREILSHLIFLAANEARMSFFEYKWIKFLRPFILSEQEKVEFLATRKIIDDFLAHFKHSEKSVFLNLPPAVIHFLCLTKNKKKW